jgi:hypothetical protein
MVLLQDPDLELSAIDADIELQIYQEKTQLQTHCSNTTHWISFMNLSRKVLL